MRFAEAEAGGNTRAAGDYCPNGEQNCECDDGWPREEDRDCCGSDRNHAVECEPPPAFMLPRTPDCEDDREHAIDERVSGKYHHECDQGYRRCEDREGADQDRNDAANRGRPPVARKQRFTRPLMHTLRTECCSHVLSPRNASASVPPGRLRCLDERQFQRGTMILERSGGARCTMRSPPHHLRTRLSPNHASSNSRVVCSAGSIWISFTTSETPGARQAALSASSLSAHERTWPRRVTFPPSATTVM